MIMGLLLVDDDDDNDDDECKSILKGKSGFYYQVDFRFPKNYQEIG